MSNIILKPALNADILWEIEQAASIAPWTLRQFTDCLAEKNPAWILWQGEQAMGFVLYHLIKGQCEIYNIAVHPDFQRQGWGKYLLEQVITLAREHACETLFLEVRASNHPARKLYQSLGFNEIGLRRAYYKRRDGTREDAIMMAKELI